MAASMDTSSSSSDNEENKEKLDPLSPIFDPRRALYAKSVKVPVPDARQFNNLAEFENYLKGTDSESQKKMKKEKEKLPGIIAERAAAQAREAVRKTALLAKSGGPHERSQTQMRKMRSTNVFTKIEGYKGPLSILRKCMQEKLKVVVVIRAAVSIRSHCKGYVIAFDKHFNMALMDVDETYIRMCKKGKEKPIPNTQEQHDHSCLSVSSADRLVQLPETKHDTVSMTTESGSQEKLSEICHGDSPQGTSLSENYSKKCNISSPAGIQTTSAGSRSKSTQDEPKQESKLNRTGEDGSSYKQTDTNENLPSRNKDAEAHNTKQETSKEPGPSALQKDTKKDSQEGVEGTSGPVKAEPDFWDLYKTWAEQRCLSKFELLERHVNQLFIRGDNVVSVSIAQ